MRQHPRLPSARRLIPALMLPLLLLSSGCPNSVGITCPQGQPWCDVIDLSVTPPDTTSAPDLTTCATRCPEGCCDYKGVCHAPPSVTACGPLGGKCEPCDPIKSDGCNPEGGCGCGIGPPCNVGTRCVRGTCVCDAKSCPDGCCGDNGQCWKPTLDHCGHGGGPCGPCVSHFADGCVMGCSCGQGPPCVEGQRCENGTCVCDAMSCQGCCDGTTCTTPSPAACGFNGAACTTCDPTLANRCGTRGCECGQQPACEMGQRCDAAGCICDHLSCPTGCCYGSTKCLPGTSASACGSKGGACATCPNLVACVNGVCAG